MLGSKRLLSQRFTIHHARNLSKVVDKLLPVIPLRDPSQWSSRRFLDIYQVGILDLQPICFSGKRKENGNFNYDHVGFIDMSLKIML